MEETLLNFILTLLAKELFFLRQDLERFVKKEKLELKTKFFCPCGNRAIIRRLLTNLLHSYSIQGNKEKAEEIQKFLQLFKVK